jgi:8-oxo-dGTP diphosphatase
MIGSVGLRLKADGKSADLGYWIGRKFWRHGYGLEAASRLTAWGLAELRIAGVTATVAEDNEASLSVLRRAGFVQTGKGKQAFLCRAEAKLPVLHFAATREASEAQAEQAEPGPRSILLVAACALIDGDSRVLLARRPEGKSMAGLWEFPGGKMNPNETPEAALIRELKEELGIHVEEKNISPFAFASHAYDGFHLLMPLYLCRRWHGKPQPKEGQALAWVARDRLVEYPMPAADRPLIPMLRDFL